MQPSYGASCPLRGDSAIVLAYVLVSIGVIVVLLCTVFMVGWFMGRRRARGRDQRGPG